MGITKTIGFDMETNEMAEVLKALGHPARLAIVKHLIQTPSCICGEIVAVLPLAQSTVSKHLSELKKVGLIQGNISGNNSCYCLNPETFNRIKLFLNTLTAFSITENKCC